MKKQVKCLETGKIYPSVTAAAKDVYLTHGAISVALRDRKRTAAGFHWIYCNPACEPLSSLPAEERKKIVSEILHSDPVFMEMLEKLKNMGAE